MPAGSRRYEKQIPRERLCNTPKAPWTCFARSDRTRNGLWRPTTATAWGRSFGMTVFCVRGRSRKKPQVAPPETHRRRDLSYKGAERRAPTRCRRYERCRAEAGRYKTAADGEIRAITEESS